jgi:hypothetical protein
LRFLPILSNDRDLGNWMRLQIDDDPGGYVERPKLAAPGPT